VPVVVDTDVLSFLYKSDTRARLYEPHLNDPPFIVSFMSVAELRRWTLERNWGEIRRQELANYLTRYFTQILWAAYISGDYSSDLPKSIRKLMSFIGGKT
jgi:predicted nucleic acid-binding protein